jgi:phosphate transport system permease protein
MILGFGRAVGEAIAVAQVIGDGLGIHMNLFDTGQTIGGKIALTGQGSQSGLETSSLFYLALILLVFSILVNLLAQFIVRRAARRQGLVAQ